MSKRPHELATGNPPSKRNCTHQSEWGLAEVLAECGCLIHATLTADDEPRTDVGCQLEPRVTPTTLCSSLNALLKEMAKNVDPDNTKIVENLEERLSASLDDAGDASAEENSRVKTKNILLRRMLLPMYRNKSEMLQSQITQMSQSPSRSVSGIKVESYSLIQVLLRIDVLQTKLLTSLIQLLPEIASRFESEHGPTLDSDIPRLIFHNLRWLDHIMDSSSLITSFSECLTVLSANSAECPKTRAILIDAIATLPDLLNDSLGGGDGIDEVLAILSMLRREDPTLLVPCLDAIDSMPLSANEVETVMGDALEALANSEAWGLPALTTFLINNCPKGDSVMAKNVIGEFRNLPLGGSGDDVIEETENPNNTEALMIEAISRGFAHRMDLTSTLLKCIKETKPGYHKTADIWLLACCASATYNQSQVNSVFRAKANDGGFTSTMLRTAIAGNGVALTSLFSSSLCGLADYLLRCSDGDACDLGITLYEVLFDEFKEPMQRQEVVGSLVTHVGAGVGSKQSEVDGAMLVFSSITSRKNDNSEESGTAALRPFAPFLTSLLEHLLQMTTSQVRRLFMLLFAVGVDNDDGAKDGGIVNEATIIIKKYLGIHGDYAKKRIGIVGTVAYAVSLSSHIIEQERSCDDGTSLTSVAAAIDSNPTINEIKRMVEFALNSCKPLKGYSTSCDTSSLGSSFSEAKSVAFLLHELGCAVRSGKLTSSIREWLEQTYETEFVRLYIGDFVIENTQDAKVGKSCFDESTAIPAAQLIPTDSDDLAILKAVSSNKLAPPSAVRFDMRGSREEIYIRILSLVASQNVSIVQLCPMFSLLSILKDSKYGGEGVSELDALIAAPLFLPSSKCSGIEFTDLSPEQQWVTTSSYYFATCWVRELINVFIRADSLKKVDASTFSSQGPIDIKMMVVDRLRNLVELEDELRFTSSKCYSFAPPGLDVCATPKELFDIDMEIDSEPDVFRRVDPNNMSKNAMQKAGKEAKKLAVKKAKQKDKSKQKRLSVKQKYEEGLAERTMKMIRPLYPSVCLALGFKELRPFNFGDQEDTKGSQLSMALSQLSKRHEPKLAEPATLLLLNVLHDTLNGLLSSKQGLPFKSGNDTNPCEDHDINSNPYGMNDIESYDGRSDLLAACDDSQRECLEMLRMLHEGDVFCAISEHLAILAESRKSDIFVDGMEERVAEISNVIFKCISQIVGSNKLIRSSAGKSVLGAILMALAEDSNESIRPMSAIDMVQLLNKLAQLINEVVTCSPTDNMVFVMNGVSCLAHIEECAQRIEKDQSALQAIPAGYKIKEMLSNVTDSLLRRSWPEIVKLNKGNVGKMLSLLLDNSYTAIPSNASAAAKADLGSLGRLSTLKLLVNDVLLELPQTEKCKGPVDLFQTCTSQTFGCYYSVVLSYLHKELLTLFESSLGKTIDLSSSKRTLEYITELISMLQCLFGLTKNNDALAKKHPLLQQLKWGSRFIETFVSKAIPFFHTHFQNHQDAISIIIKDLQKASRQLYHIISHGKRVKDSNLAKETPRAKKSLELFIHKVKALLKKNRCLTAMWTKELKSKDIDGTTLKVDNTSIDDGQDIDEDESVENRSLEGSDQSDDGYETDNQSVDD